MAFFPANRAALDARLSESLSAVPDVPAEAAGVALGRAVGDVVLEARAGDGFGIADPFIPTPGPGVWKPTPPAFAPMLEPQFQNVTPFMLRNRAQLVPEPPPALTSRRYARDYNEVKRIGQDTSPARTADQTHVAHFWIEPWQSGWSRVGNLVSARYGYDLHRTARLQALLNMAMADGFVVGWFQKRHFAFWRPVTAIREAGNDGNAQPCPTRPGCPCARRRRCPTTRRRTACSAAPRRRSSGGSPARARFKFCMVSATPTPSGTERCWDSFTRAELENAESRVLTGFHFRFATDTGVKVGRRGQPVRDAACTDAAPDARRQHQQAGVAHRVATSPTSVARGVTGRGLSLVATTCPRCGSVRISWAGTVRTVSLRSSKPGRRTIE